MSQIDEALRLMKSAGELAGSVDALVNERDYLRKRNEELTQQLAEANLKIGQLTKEKT